MRADTVIEVPKPISEGRVEVPLPVIAGGERVVLEASAREVLQWAEDLRRAGWLAMGEEDPHSQLG